METNVIKKIFILLLFTVIFNGCSAIYSIKIPNKYIRPEVKREMIINDRRVQKKKRLYKKHTFKNKTKLNSIQRKGDGREYYR